MSADPVTLRSSRFEVSVDLAHGCLIRQVEHMPSGTRLLWQRTPHPNLSPPAGGPDEANPELGPPGEPSVATFDDHLLRGGWFVMAPSAGMPGTLGGRATWMHGEAPRLPWSRTQTDTGALTAAIDLPVSGLHLNRTLEVTEEGLRVRTQMSNPGSRSVPCTYGEHPCLAAAVFSGADLHLGAEQRATAPAGGGSRLYTLPLEPDGSHEHAVLEAATGEARLESDRGTWRMTWSVEELGHVVVWRHLEPPGSRIPGATLAVEPMSAPGLGVDDAGPSDVTVLEPGHDVQWEVSMTWVPAGR